MSHISSNFGSLKDIATTLINYTLEQAKLNEEEKKFLVPEKKYAPGEASADAEFQERIEHAAHLSPESKLKVARAMSAERIVLNAIGNMYRAEKTPTPRERFEAYFENGLKGKTPDEQKAFIDTLKLAQEKMVINVVQTMHPTIYHTEFGRQMETALTAQLEVVAKGYKKEGADYQGQDRPDIEAAQKIINTMVGKIMDGPEKGATVTPDKQVSVVAENALDKDNHILMRKAFGAVVDDYNLALELVANRSQINLSQDLKEQMLGSAINRKQAVWRTWAYGADADGRDQSTSVVLWSGINHQVKEEYDNKYISRKRDLRENAKDQRQTVSCLIQRAFRKDGDFRAYCEDFHADHAALPQKEKEAIERERLNYDPEKNKAFNTTVLQLSEEEQAKIYRDLLAGDFGKHTDALSDFHLVPTSLSNQTVEFNEMFAKEYRDYIVEKRKLQPIDALPDINSLSDEEKKELTERVNQKVVLSGPKREMIHFKVEMGKDPSEMLYSPEEGENRDFLSNAQRTVLKKETKKNGDGTEITYHPGDNVDMDAKERRKVLDVVKRLEVLNHAINVHGDKVADRYQIANFESAADFYSTLLLFKETDILETEKIKVVKDGKEVEETVVKQRKADQDGKGGSPKLSIQPLLETKEDQERAPDLFRELLEDPLVRSYYQALGNRADIMVGYSDGAKSAGNMASEWSIYKCKTELKKIFKGHNINVNFFDGRGRGDSRGGQFDEGQNYRMSPPEVHQDMRYDETMQSDAPMKGAISIAQGQDTLTSIITGVLTAKQESDIELKKREEDTAYETRVKAMDKVVDGMTALSSQTYCDLVRNNPNTDKLLATVHDNIFKSSRPASRGNKTFEDQRAIGVEYGFNMADAPLHYIGMRKALEEFAKGTLSLKGEDGKDIKLDSITDTQGNTVTGKQALEVLYKSHPFFHNFIDKTAHGLRDYDPTVFLSYAKVAGAEDWAKECVADLNGLRELVLSISKQEATIEASGGNPKTDRPESFVETVASEKRPTISEQYEARAVDHLRDEAIALDKAAHALVLSSCTGNNGNLRPLSEEQKGLMKLTRLDATDLEKKGPALVGMVRQMAEINDLVSFVASESNRTKGVFAPARITAAVDHRSMA